MTSGFWDPLRKKTVAATPEEKVRQWFISILRDKLGVPESLMMSEAGFRFGRKLFRADILIYGRDTNPLGIVECKRPDVELSADVAMQAMKYNAVLSVKYIFLTNGKSLLAFRRDGDCFKPLSKLPEFSEMIQSLPSERG